MGTIGSAVKIVKSVNKHNNGKVFKITRSFVQVEEAAGSPGTIDGTTGDTFSFGAGKGHSVLVRASTVVISDKAGSCAAKKATDYSYPFNRVITDQTNSAGALAVTTVGAIAHSGSNADCNYSVQRYVITLDSMPTASAYSIAKTLLYKSPVGSCNVAETTKGTFESYECSNRGACDGSSGLCACYEGYSGESSRPKPSWSKEGHSFIAWTAKFIMWFWQHMLQPKKHYFMPHWQTGEVCPLLYNHKYHQKAFVFF